MKMLLKTSLFLVFLLGVCAELTAQTQLFLVNKKYLDNLSSNRSTGLLEINCYAMKIKLNGTQLVVREYTTMDHANGWILSGTYNTYTYTFDVDSAKFLLGCGTSEGRGAFAHQHTDGGYHWISIDEFGDYLLSKNCGAAKAVNKFVVKDQEDYLK